VLRVLLLLLLRQTLLMLLQFLWREEDLDLLTVRTDLGAVRLAIRGEEDLGATTTAATSAAAAALTGDTRLTLSLHGLAGLTSTGRLTLGSTVIGTVVAIVTVVSAIVHGSRRRNRGDRSARILILREVAHEDVVPPGPGEPPNALGFRGYCRVVDRIPDAGSIAWVFPQIRKDRTTGILLLPAAPCHAGAAFHW
jgi:hypothetical protein